MPDPLAVTLLRALGDRPGARPYLEGGVNDQQVDVALDALRNAGLVTGLELTEQGRKLLEDLNK